MALNENGDPATLPAENPPTESAVTPPPVTKKLDPEPDIWGPTPPPVNKKPDLEPNIWGTTPPPVTKKPDLEPNIWGLTPPPLLPSTPTAPYPLSVTPPPTTIWEERQTIPPTHHRRWFSLGLAILTLGVVGSSIALLILLLRMNDTDRVDFVLRNVRGDVKRRIALISLSAGFFFTLLLCGLACLRKRWRSRAFFEQWGTLVAPLTLVGVLPILFIWQFGQQQTLSYLVILTGFIFVERALLTRAFRQGQTMQWPSWLRVPKRLRRIHLPSWWALVLVCLACAAYIGFTGFFTIMRHRLIQTRAFDLGIYDNLLNTALHGKLFYSPVLFGPGNRSYIAGHAEYSMLLFLPFYAIRPHAETMLWIQSAFLGLAALPLYFLTRQFLGRGVSLIFALSYLMLGALHGPHFYDFHWLPLICLLFFGLFQALATNRRWLAVFLVVVLLTTREDIALDVGFFGIFLLAVGAHVRFALVMTLVSFVWFGINKFIIMPFAGPWWFENLYAELFSDGKGTYGSVLTTIITNPVYTLTTLIREPKLIYFLHMMVPFAFLPLRRISFLLLFIPAAFFTLFTTSSPPLVSISFQYTTHWIPFLFLSSILGLWLYKSDPKGRAKMRAAVVVMVIAGLSHSYSFGAILQRNSFVGGFDHFSFKMTESDQTRYRDLKKVLDLIPKNASVGAGEYTNPHISARLHAYVFRNDPGPVDYILFSNKELNEEFKQILRGKIRQEKYGLVLITGDEFYLFKREHFSEKTEEALRRLGL